MSESEKRESFVFYRSFYEAIKNIPKKHRTEVYDAVFAYVFESSEPSLKGIPRALWELIRPQLDASERRYANARKGAEYGKKGGRPRKNVGDKKPLKGYENKTLNVNVNDNDNVNVNVNENVNDKGLTETRPSLPPSEKICQAYIDMKATIRGITPDFNASKFISYYNARDWMSGNTKIADWKAAVDIWLNRSEEKICADDDEDPFADLKGSF